MFILMSDTMIFKIKSPFKVALLFLSRGLLVNIFPRPCIGYPEFMGFMLCCLYSVAIVLFYF